VDETALATLANGLSARVVTKSTGGTAAPVIDMMALWPNDTNPTWLIACNEEGSGQVALQRIRISDGLAETIVNSGLVSCDPSHRTPWGTIVFAEENGTSGRLFELIDPLTTTGVSLVGGTPTCVSPPADPGCTGAGNIVERNAVGKLSFEGIAVYPNGVMYYGDENRPNLGTAGGAYFKFVSTCGPTNSCPTGSLPGADNTAKLASSPLVSGSIFGLRLGKRDTTGPPLVPDTDYGQGTQTGLGTWIPVPGAAPRQPARRGREPEADRVLPAGGHRLRPGSARRR